MRKTSHLLSLACLFGTLASASAAAASEHHAAPAHGTPKVEPKFRSDLAGLKENHTLAMLVVTLPANSKEPAHTHPGDEILFCLSGKGMVDVDGVQHKLEPGVVVLVRRGQKKTLSSEGEAEPLSVLAYLVLEKNLPPIEIVGGSDGGR